MLSHLSLSCEVGFAIRIYLVAAISPIKWHTLVAPLFCSKFVFDYNDPDKTRKMQKRAARFAGYAG